MNDSKKATKIKQTTVEKKYSHEEFSKGIGASEFRELKIEHLEPLTLSGIFHSAIKNLKSTGGRPGRIGDTYRKKIPISDGEWKELESLSVVLHNLGVNVSTGQVAGLLIEKSLEQIKPSVDAINAEYSQLVQAAANAKTGMEGLEPIANILKNELLYKRLAELIPGLSLFKVEKHVAK
ncbi:MAG: hypothetical protein HS129_14745 [Leptospiraceae bacterium]|nr:hypothetical protein [Leptospiraceae bacterium]